MKLKGDEKVTKVINTFLKQFGLTCKLGNDFAYYPGDDLITYAFAYVDIDAEGFMRSIERLNPQVKADIFLWSLLHEVGHHETIDMLTDKENRACDKAKKKLNKRSLRGEIVDLDEYYDMLDERLATEWAVDYANRHPKTLEKTWEIISRAIRQFYELNEIEV